MQDKSIGKINTANDDNLIDQIKTNDKNVLKALYADNFYKFRAYTLKNNGTEYDAKDVYQDAFLAFWRNVQLDKFTTLNSDTVDRYILKIAKNKWIDFLRNKKRLYTVNIEEWDIPEEPSPLLNEREEKYIDMVKINFSKLGHPCKELLYRFYFKKERLHQIAQVFSWKESTVKNNKYRCLQKLRKAVLNNL